MITPLQNWDSVKRAYRHGDWTYYGSKHRGVDYVVPEETPVFAPADCKVVLSKKFQVGGNTVWIEFDDTDSSDKIVMRCLHLNSLPSLGSYNEGSIIAYTGNTGLSTNPHLHLDLSKNEFNLYAFDNFIDPDAFFYSRVASNQDFIKRWEGKFILDVDQLGEVYYVHEGKRYKVDFKTFPQMVANRFATGFTHKDVERIPQG